MIGLITGQPVGARMPGSLAALMLAVQNGADRLRARCKRVLMCFACSA